MNYPPYAPTQPVYVHGPSRGSFLWVKILVTLGLGLVLFFGLLALVPSVYARYYAGRIFPGVSVAGVDLSGLHLEEAATLLTQRLNYSTQGLIVFQEGANVWNATPREIGLFLDYVNSAQAAYDIGRKGGFSERLSKQYRAWEDGIDLPPLMVYDERMAHEYLGKIAAQVDRPVVEATLSVAGVDVVVNSGQVGRTLDVAEALARLQAHLPSLTDTLIPLTVRETPPVILDATTQAEVARKILSAALMINVPNPETGDPGPWVFDQSKLAAMLTIERVETSGGASYQVGLDTGLLRTFLEGLAPSFARTPVNARFIFNDDTKKLEVIEHAVIGRSLDVEATLQSMREKVFAGEHSVSLILQQTNPSATDDTTGEQLGITQLVSSQTTYFRGSIPERMQNIKIASSRFHGLLVPPGATFSMADVLGDVSLDAGYAEALIIFGDRTIKGVGGGVCQVSTTLFRTVFFGGFPVVVRYAHAYRVGYYEQTASGHDSNLAGLDATVFAPVVDFQFTNDTPYWLLMETYVNTDRQTLTWKFYSTSDGRSVDWTTSGPQNITDPDSPLYEENPDLPTGTIKQTEYEARGADVTVSRTVYRDGQVWFADTFNTHYLPWRAVYQYGPGTEGIPTPEPTPEPTTSP